jgi:hypothetical protein
VAVHPVRLDERHRGGDAAEQRLVDRLGGCRRGRRLGGGRSVTVAEHLNEPLQPGVGGDELAVAALEELTPLGRDGVRVLEVVLEQEPGIARVQPVDVAVAHTMCCSNPA